MEDREYLTGQLLIAMPGMRDSRFARTVISVCAHHPDGAMGLVINRLVGAITFPDLLAQLGIGPLAVNDEIRVHFGGPVESGAGSSEEHTSELQSLLRISSAPCY